MSGLLHEYSEEIVHVTLVFLILGFVAHGLTLLNSEDFSQQDVEFMQGMSVHHDQAIVMSNWAPERTNNSQVLELAENISDVQGQEHRQMENWLRENNYEVHSEMSGQMKGMASEQQMQQLNNSTGHEFDMLYLELMIEHHIGGVEMAEKQVRQGSNQKLIEMAESMVKIQEEEISLMREWQNEWNNG